MKFALIFALAILVVCLPLSAFADSASFLNHDGTWTAFNGDELILTLSSLSMVSGLPNLAYDCVSISDCNGSVYVDTGHTKSSGSLGGPAATFGPGGNFDVTSGKGPSGGLQYQGSFSSGSWTESLTGTSSAFWTFIGIVSNGTLTEGGVPMMNIAGATVDLTTMTGPPMVVLGPDGKYHNTWTDAGGTSTITLPLAPVPEQGTLTLLGTGLIGIGVLARRRGSRQTGRVV